MPLLGGLLALYLLVPVAVLLVHLAGGGRGMSTDGLASATWVSLLTATIATAVVGVLGIPLAWLLAQNRGPVWDAVGVAVQLPLALPPLMGGILLIQIVGPYTFLGRLFGGGLTDTKAAIILAQTFVAAPFLVISARSAFGTVDPGLNEVAATLGHGGWSRFRRVSLPVAAPGIRAGLLLTWLRAFGEFGATIILAYHPYSLPVFTFVQFSSTGLPSALPPTGVAIGAAAVVLALTGWWPGRLLGGRRRRGSVPPEQVVEVLPGPEAALPPPLAARADHGRLSFDLRDRIGKFGLHLAHQGHAPHLAILGPSGAGKSLTLRCLAGLRGRDTGTVRVAGRELGRLLPEQRRIGWVPQDAGLLPHLNVWQQVTFGVSADPGVAHHWLVRLGIAELSRRRPHELSGGQRQRVALARALACEPDLLLLDEPFSSLDAPVRDELRRELRRLQREVGIATVVVTHDPEEAALLAEEVIVLAEGRVRQAGTRAAVFERPASPEVARLLRIDNLKSGRILGPGRIHTEGVELVGIASRAEAGTEVMWCVRAEHVSLLPLAEGGSDGYPGSISEVFDLGVWREVTVRLDGGLTLTARTVDGRDLAPGRRCRVGLPPGDITVWAHAGEATLTAPAGPPLAPQPGGR